jgi:hypothetical protein
LPAPTSNIVQPAAPLSTRPVDAVCFGVCCPIHQDCVHYHAVEMSNAGRHMATCMTEPGQYPRFVAIAVAPPSVRPAAR